jgi:hypothetical protein
VTAAAGGQAALAQLAAFMPLLAAGFAGFVIVAAAFALFQRHLARRRRTARPHGPTADLLRARAEVRNIYRHDREQARLAAEERSHVPTGRIGDEEWLSGLDLNEPGGVRPQRGSTWAGARDPDGMEPRTSASAPNWYPEVAGDVAAGPPAEGDYPTGEFPVFPAGYAPSAGYPAGPSYDPDELPSGPFQRPPRPSADYEPLDHPVTRELDDHPPWVQHPVHTAEPSEDVDWLDEAAHHDPRNQHD